MHQDHWALSREVAEDYLRTIDPPWRWYWFHMHLVAKNLEEFSYGLFVVSDEVFREHTSDGKNDLALWVREVIGDGVLSHGLRAVRSRAEAAELTASRVKELKEALQAA